MPELIDRESVLKKLCEICNFHTSPDFVCRKCNVYEMIAVQPTIRSDFMYIIYVKDGLGGWFECGAYDTYDEAYEAMSEMSKDDPFHKYKVVHK